MRMKMRRRNDSIILQDRLASSGRTKRFEGETLCLSDASSLSQTLSLSSPSRFPLLLISDRMPHASFPSDKSSNKMTKMMRIEEQRKIRRCDIFSPKRKATRSDRSNLDFSNNNKNHDVFKKCLTTSLIYFTILILTFTLSCLPTSVQSYDHRVSREEGNNHLSQHSNHNKNFRHETFEEDFSDNINSDFTTVFYTTNKGINFTHVVVDPSTGKVYLGATNWLYQLNSNLSLEHGIKTGPVDDSPNCSPTDCIGVDASLIRSSKNTNKILVIDHTARMLIACGSVHQGSCRRHSLNDIRNAEPLVGVPVAANDENSSTIAFVANARYGANSLTSLSNPQPASVLYVGASNSKLGPYRDVVPAISSRSLESGPRLFSIIEKSFTDTARVDIEIRLRDYFLVKYITGFSRRDYVYFATVQRKSHFRSLEEWGYISRLARVCSSDAGYHTYTEMTISCLGNDGTDYNLLQDGTVVKAGAILSRSLGLREGEDILVGTFAASKDHTTIPSQKSAVCLFPLSEIERGFNENIHLCYNGSVSSRNMDYIAGSMNECPEPKKTLSVEHNFCNEAIKLNGSLPLVVSPAIIFKNTSLTGIAVTTTGPHTVAFVGTASGSLKKIMMTSGIDAEEFEEVVIDSGHPILEDILLDPTGKYVYVSSPYRVAKVRVESCHRKTNCSSCLSSRNPFCGWCSLESRCASRQECEGPSTSPLKWSLSSSSSSHLTSRGNGNRWLPIDTSSQCVTFSEIKPSSFLPIDSSVSSIELLIQQLPSLPRGVHYLCTFTASLSSDSHLPSSSTQTSSSSQRSPATLYVKATGAKFTRSGLSCPLPSFNDRPRIPLGRDHVSLTLAVKSTLTDMTFIEKPFIFYDCSNHKTCRSCVSSSSSFTCNWCVREGICSNNITACGTSTDKISSSATSWKKVIASESSTDPHVVKGVEYCPSFKLDREILIPHGARREISIDVRNLVHSVSASRPDQQQLSLSHFLPHPLNTQLTSSNGFECVVEIEGARERVPARIKQDKIICSENSYTYQAEVPEMMARLEVIREGETFIDRMNFTLYKCNLFASYSPKREDCSLCQIVDRKYNCVWCSNTCSYVDACFTEKPAASCPPSSSNRIEPFYPQIHGSPIEVSTLSRVEGANRDDDNDADQEEAGHREGDQVSNHMHSKHKTSSTELSPLVICLVSGAAVGVVLVIVLIAFTTVKRKGSSGSSSSSGGSSSLSSGHHHLFSTSDAVIGTKIPNNHQHHPYSQHPLISNCKPLPLVPLIDRESSLYDKVNPCQAPPTTQPPPLPVTQIKSNQLLQSPSTESAVNVIYSEINDYNLEDEEEDARVLISSSTSGHGGPQLIHLHHQGRNPSPNMTATRTVNYPQFITFNTVGRNSQRNGNAYVFHDSIPASRYRSQQKSSSSPQTTQAITVANNSSSNSGGSNGINTYAVYAYEKFTRNQRGRQSNNSSSSSRDRFV